MLYLYFSYQDYRQPRSTDLTKTWSHATQMKWSFSCNPFPISCQSCPLNFLSVYTLKPASTEWLQCSEGETDFHYYHKTAKKAANATILLSRIFWDWMKISTYDLWKWRPTHIAGQKSSTNFLSLRVQHTTVLVKVTIFFCGKREKHFIIKNITY